jgi:hypothetical protein
MALPDGFLPVAIFYQGSTSLRAGSPVEPCPLLEFPRWALSGKAAGGLAAGVVATSLAPPVTASTPTRPAVASSNGLNLVSPPDLCNLGGCALLLSRSKIWNHALDCFPQILCNNNTWWRDFFSNRFVFGFLSLTLLASCERIKWKRDDDERVPRVSVRG